MKKVAKIQAKQESGLTTVQQDPPVGPPAIPPVQPSAPPTQSAATPVQPAVPPVNQALCHN